MEAAAEAMVVEVQSAEQKDMAEEVAAGAGS